MMVPPPRPARYLLILGIFLPLVASQSIDITCESGDFSLGDRALVTCHFPVDISTGDFHYIVTSEKGDDVIKCDPEGCQSAKGFYLDPHTFTKNDVTIVINDVTQQSAGYYFCQLVPPKDFQRKKCYMSVSSQRKVPETTSPKVSIKIDNIPAVVKDQSPSTWEITTTVIIAVVVVAVVVGIICFRRKVLGICNLCRKNVESGTRGKDGHNEENQNTILLDSLKSVEKDPDYSCQITEVLGTAHCLTDPGPIASGDLRHVKDVLTKSDPGNNASRPIVLILSNVRSPSKGGEISRSQPALTGAGVQLKNERSMADCGGAKQDSAISMQNTSDPDNKNTTPLLKETLPVKNRTDDPNEEQSNCSRLVQTENLP